MAFGIISDPLGLVIVQAPPVEFLADQLQVAIFDDRHAVAERLDEFLRIFALEDGIEEGAIVELMRTLAGGKIGRAVGAGNDRGGVEHKPDRHVGGFRADRLDAETVGKVHVMHGVKGSLHVALARSMDAVEVAEPDDAPGFVEGRNPVEAIAKTVHHRLGIALKRIGGRTRGPAALAGEQQRQIPVVERCEGLDAARLAAVNQPVVEIEAGLVHRTRAFGDNARPGNREPVGVDTHLLDEIEVLFQAIVVIAGNVAVIAIMDAARHIAESIPDGWLAAIGLAGAFDLEGSGGNAESEVAGQALCQFFGSIICKSYL